MPWSQVREPGTRRGTSRLGLASTTIEIDLVDDDLLVFGRTDLGADPADVLAALRGWFADRPTARAVGRPDVSAPATQLPLAGHADTAQNH